MQGLFTVDEDRERRRNLQSLIEMFDFLVIKLDRLREVAGAVNMTISVYCRSGKHRSVVLSEIVAKLFRLLGANVICEHLCQWWWRYNRCMRQARERARVLGDRDWSQAVCPRCFGADFAAAKNDFLQDVAAHVLRSSRSRVRC